MQNLSRSVIGALDVLGAGFGMVRNLSGAFGRKWLLLLALVCAPGWLFAQTPPTATYYVATTGSDSNAGTSPTTPFLTIQHALNLCTGGQTVAVASGTYTPTSGNLVTDTTKTRTSMVTIFGWGATQPVLQAAVGNFFLLNLSGNDLTFDNFALRSTNNKQMVPIGGATNVVIENCDISNPDTADPAQTTDCPDVQIGYSSTNITVQNCYIHDSEAAIAGPGNAATNECNNIQLLNNTIKNMTCDGIQFGTWNNVLIDGNVIDGVADFNSSGVHNDGIQFTGNTQNATITHNVITGILVGQGMLIQSSVGVVDNVLVANNLIYNIGTTAQRGFAIQNGATHAVFLNNTMWESAGIVLRAGYNGAVISDSVEANNITSSLGYLNGASSAYEDYNYTQSGFASGTGPHDQFGTNPGFVNVTADNFHPASGSLLFGAGVHSFSATVDGVVTVFNAPANDLDYITRGNPPTIGAYETTLGNTAIAYSGFDYSSTGAASGLTDGALDFGWTQTTWSAGTIVSSGLAYSSLPVIGKALSFSANVPCTRTIDPSAMPAGYTVTGSDGVARLGKAGTTIWFSFLIEPTVNQSGSLVGSFNLTGQSVGGGVKLQTGNVTAANTSWGVGNPFTGLYAYATGAAPITTNQVAFIVVSVQFTTGNSVVNMWVNPPLGNTPPATPSATISTNAVGPFNIADFAGTRTSTADELSIGTSWLSVVSGGQP